MVLPCHGTQSATPEEAYPTEVGFVRTINKGFAPPRLRLVAALHGFTPPPAHGFDFCEVGSGTGDSLVLLAAAHPGSRFLGLDINAEHVAFADAMASAGKVDNVRFLERDFEGLDGYEAPAFDYIAAHGLLTWVSPAKRGALLAFAEKMLRPGGLLYVSYDTLPGWAAVEPLRRLMLDGSAGVTHLLERARRGVALAQRFADAKAEYFTDNAMAGAMLAKMTRVGLPYVVHEYFGPHWHPMYFADVAREAAAHDLQFVGQCPPDKSFRDLALPPELLPLVEGAPDRLVFETLKDYALNETFRQDVYVKGPAACSPAATEAYLDTTPFGTLVPASRLEREIRLRRCTIPLDGPVFDALLPAIAERPLSAGELVRLPALADFGAARVRDALRSLLFGEQVAPLEPGTPPLAPVSPGRCRVPLAYNHNLLHLTFPDEDTVTVFSPAAGVDLCMPLSEAILTLAVTGAEPGAYDRWLDGFCRFAMERSLRVGERSIEDPAEMARALTEALPAFCAEQLPKLVQLGVLEEG